jgi:hypothetical protein
MILDLPLDLPLDQALAMAGMPEELRLIGPMRAARAEAAALAGDADASLAEADATYERALLRRHQWVAGELAYWRWRAGVLERPPEWIATPFALQIAGEWRAAADAWHRLGCPYEEARALAEGDAGAQERALAIFDRLGAAPAAAEVRREYIGAGTPILTVLSTSYRGCPGPSRSRCTARCCTS